MKPLETAQGLSTLESPYHSRQPIVFAAPGLELL